MNYDELLKSLKLYGTNKEDIIKRRGYEKILKNVVVAPWWEHTLFNDYCSNIEQVGDKVYNIKGENFNFSFIEIKNIGASALLEEVLALGVTNCKNILFIGSAGALDEKIKIGDLIIPSCSINGVGATRYLNDNLEDDFEYKYYPSEKLTKKLINSIKNIGSQVKLSQNYSVDTIIAQFPHINHIKDLGATTIEMETSTLFKCCNIINVEATALFVISDNTTVNKSLYSGRSEEDSNKKKIVRKQILPKIVIDLFKNKC